MINTQKQRFYTQQLKNDPFSTKNAENAGQNIQQENTHCQSWKIFVGPQEIIITTY